MTEEERLTILNEVKELSDWMEEACGAECGTIEEMIAGTTDAAYEVIVTIGLTSGKEIVLHNRCFESFIKKMYKGDTLYCRDGLIYTDFIDYNAGDAYRQAKIVPSTVCYIDGRSVELDWPALYKQYMATRDIHEEGAGCELPPAEDILEKLKEDFSLFDKEVREKLSRLVKESEERGIDVSDVVPGSYKHLIGKIVKVNKNIKDLYKGNPCPFRVFKTPILLNDGSRWPKEPTNDLILHQPNHNEKALGLLPGNQPETMAAKYWEVFGND